MGGGLIAHFTYDVLSNDVHIFVLILADIYLLN